MGKVYRVSEATVRKALKAAHAKGYRLARAEFDALLARFRALKELNGHGDLFLKAWDESRHPRDHGKFSGTGGTQIPGGAVRQNSAESPETSQKLPGTVRQTDPEHLAEHPAEHPAAEKARTLLARVAEVPGHVRRRVTAFVQARYQKLSARYGPTGAKAVLAAMVALSPVPLPGTSLLPIAIAEAVKRVHDAIRGDTMGKAVPPEMGEEEVNAVARQLLADLYAEVGEEPPAVVKAWDESQHPRGQPENAGEFAAESGRSATSDASEGERFPPADAVRRKGMVAETDVPDQALIGDLDKNTLAALKLYTRKGDGPMNALLRRNAPIKPQLAQAMSTIRAAFRNADEFDKPVTAWRGIKLDADKTAKLMEVVEQAKDGGRPLVFKGFTSTTINPDVAADFGDIWFEVSVKKGLYLEPVSEFGGEQELLIDHGSRFRVHGVREVDYQPTEAGVKRVRVIQLEHLPDDDSEGVNPFGKAVPPAGSPDRSRFALVGLDEIALGDSPVVKAVRHAPKGGISLGGKKFTGGEFIPTADLERASPEEKAELKRRAGKGAPERVAKRERHANPADVYRPDPAQPNPRSGLVEQARVGVPARHVPPPPSIPRLPNLSEDQREVEARFAAAYEADPDGMAKKYLKALRKRKVGVEANIFATDDVKALNPDWNPGRIGVGEELDKKTKKAMARYNTAVHQTANAIAKRAFLLYLDMLPPGKRTVLVTNGGCAAGKGSSLARAADPNTPYAGILPAAAHVGAVWDAAGEQNATENEWILEECQKRGIKPTFAYVYADPKDTWEAEDRGVIRRAARKGRMVDARLFADSYAHGARNMHAFHQKHKGDADFIFVDNRKKGAPKLMAGVPPEALAWDADAIYRDAKASLERHRDDLPPALVEGGLAGATIWGEPHAGK